MAQDAVALIKADHRKVEQLFREFEEAGDRADKTRRQLVEQITRELEVHAAIEVTVLMENVRHHVEEEEHLPLTLTGR
jgi:hemerythrin superfamily protein